MSWRDGAKVGRCRGRTSCFHSGSQSLVSGLSALYSKTRKSERLNVGKCRQMSKQKKAAQRGRSLLQLSHLPATFLLRSSTPRLFHLEWSGRWHRLHYQPALPRRVPPKVMVILDVQSVPVSI